MIPQNLLMSLLYKTLNLPLFLRTKIQSQYFKSKITCDRNVKFLTSARVFNIRNDINSIQIKKNSIIAGELLTFAHGGKITIGEWCYFGEGSRIWSAAHVRVGNRVLISHNVNIHDTNSHPINSKLRHEHFAHIFTHGHPKEAPHISSKTITISDDVWIGFNSTILKGVSIGEGSIIGACSLVTKNVPSHTVVAGNPAQVIRTIEKNENH